MAKYALDEYDRRTLREALQRVLVVYEYHYGAPGYKATTNKLERVIRTLGALAEENADG